MILASLAVVAGLILLVWSADRFVDGSAATARYFGMPSLLIGMVIVGFGTSAPEMVVSTLASLQGNPSIALGNAYGSNIVNIAVILGLTAILSPIIVNSQVLKKELPILTLVTIVAMWQALDGEISRVDAVVLLLLFSGLFGWTIFQGLQKTTDSFMVEMEHELTERSMPIRMAVVWLIIGLLLLIVSSQMLVWGAVEIAKNIGVSDLIIGLTIVAMGTSLPELASSIMAARKGEHDIALGNIIGSNMFNTLIVVGIAGTIHPVSVEAEVISRDIPVMMFLTVLIFILGHDIRRQPKISRLSGGFLILCYIAYTASLIYSLI